MSKAPSKSPSQKNYIHSAVRLPPELRQALIEAAERNGRSMNAEIIARLQESPLDAVMAEIAELKQMLRKALDQM